MASQVCTFCGQKTDGPNDELCKRCHLSSIQLTLFDESRVDEANVNCLTLKKLEDLRIYTLNKQAEINSIRQEHKHKMQILKTKQMKLLREHPELTFTQTTVPEVPIKTAKQEPNFKYLSELSPQQMLANPLCPICEEDFSSNGEFILTKCKHLYHKDCLEQWLAKAKSCPICRCIIAP